MVLEADYLRLLNSQTLNRFNMHLGTGKIKKDPSDLYGSQESKNNIIINRKILSELVVSDESTFKKVVELATK